MRYAADISNQRADHDDAMRAEGLDRNDWADDDRPTKAELDRDEWGYQS